jgi:pyruvate dehydrogenase E1 component alpha subunit
MYVTMLRIRRLENRLVELLRNREIKCPTHLYTGQEAIAAGVCASLRQDDYVFSTHRSHGHYIAKGGDLKALMAELFGKSTGCSRGRGGSMHLVDPEVGLMGSAAIVASTIPLAVGTALASAMQGNNRVAVAFFGDGATDEGVFDESLNFASLRKLPVVFICENNLFSTHLPLYLRQPADNIASRAKIHLMPAVRIDGNNVLKVYETSRQAITDARNGRGPSLIECRTYRWRAHVGWPQDYDVGYRTKKEVQKWEKRCPIKAYEKFLVGEGVLSESEMKQIAGQIDRDIEEALTFAHESPFPDESEITEGVYK